MTRAPFQVLVIPYRLLPDDAIAYAVFRCRRGEVFWQAIAGGGEDGETPLEAARREAWEEAGITPDHAFMPLDSMATIPIIHFPDHQDREDLFVVPEHSFGVAVSDNRLRLSHEHSTYLWLPYEGAHDILRWDSNRNALWELDRRLKASLKARGRPASGA
jgi:dATP pyrophosphohydrolase